jgi:hypothetical protein
MCVDDGECPWCHPTVESYYIRLIRIGDDIESWGESSSQEILSIDIYTISLGWEDYIFAYASCGISACEELVECFGMLLFVHLIHPLYSSISLERHTTYLDIIGWFRGLHEVHLHRYRISRSHDRLVVSGIE